ncbi:LysM repeat protein [Thermonema lapsum]|uniref:LysM repeat protein n=1 Tax=Thermonema lapsum TaxID=28195 RepID=A0A846MRJ7_9BACT|nr:LysM domain-containing protein [Thermonema lapsum]NIK74206.1 LysM repeat protein [Thermonema lapsum]
MPRLTHHKSFLLAYRSSPYNEGSCFLADFHHANGDIYILCDANAAGQYAPQVSRQITDLLQTHIEQHVYKDPQELIDDARTLLNASSTIGQLPLPPQELSLGIVIWSNHQIFWHLQGSAVLYLKKGKHLLSFYAHTPTRRFLPKPHHMALVSTCPLLQEEVLKNHFLEATTASQAHKRTMQALTQSRFGKDVAACFIEFEEAELVESPQSAKRGIFTLLTVLAVLFVSVWIIHLVYSYQQQRKEAKEIEARQRALLEAKRIADSLRLVDQQPDSIIIHKVKAGETATSIAQKYNTTLDSLREWNDFVPLDKLYPGFRLRVKIKMLFTLPEAMTLEEVHQKYFKRWEKYGITVESLRRLNSTQSDSLKDVIPLGYSLMIPVWKPADSSTVSTDSNR